MGNGQTEKMDKTQELTTRFEQIDLNSNGSLELSELANVFGEHAEEFLKFCDSGDKDRVLSPEEFCKGISDDTANMSDDDFKSSWLERMDGCIADRPKDAGTLVYFGGIRSRGESCRMVAAYGGVKLEDELLDFDAWGARKSDAIPHMPYIIPKEADKKCDEAGNCTNLMFETEDILKYLAKLDGKFTVDAKQEALAKKANNPPLFMVDPYLNMPEPMWESFGLPAKAEWLATVPAALKELADELGDGPFFGGATPGYGEAFLNAFAELPGIKEYIANRPAVCGLPGSTAAQV